MRFGLYSLERVVFSHEDNQTVYLGFFLKKKIEKNNLKILTKTMG